MTKRLVQIVFAFLGGGGVAERRLELLEPPDLDAEGGVERGDGGDVALHEVGQVQGSRPHHGEVRALAEVLRLVQGRRHERQTKSFG